MAIDWEKQWLRVMNRDLRPGGLPEGARLVGVAESSKEDLAVNPWNALPALSVGFSCMFLYILFVMGRPNLLEQRVVLAIVGLLCIGMAAAASAGLCFLMGMSYTTVHPAYPFLLLGLGVDDMFVITHSLEKLDHNLRSRPTEVRVGLALKQSGLSVSLTSATDLLAFLIGASSSLPVLRSFCVFTAVGVVLLYLFSMTVFVGVLALDDGRMSRREVVPGGCGRCCPLPASYEPYRCSRFDLGDWVVERLSRWLFWWPVKAAVLLAAAALFSVGVYGVVNMPAEVDFHNYQDRTEPSYKMRKIREEYYGQTSDDGGPTMVYLFTGNMSYADNLDGLLRVGEVLASSEYVEPDSISFWFEDFYREKCGRMWQDCTQEGVFDSRLSNFRPDRPGDFRLDPNASDPLPIIGTRGTFNHVPLTSTAERVHAAKAVKANLSQISFVGTEDTAVDRHPFAFTRIYILWAVNEIIKFEVARSLALMATMVAVLTMAVAFDPRFSLVIVASVALTVVDLCGFAYFWDVQLEIVTATIIIISGGLAFDYPAHIGVAYITSHEGSRKQRAAHALRSMGVAVFHGCFSNFLALCPLMFNEQYIFFTFFKMFFMINLFGLFHAVIVVPVLLSMVGPENAEVDARKRPLQKEAALSGSSGPAASSSLPTKQPRS